MADTLSHRWQFAAFAPPERALQWLEQALPAPGPGQALVRIRAVGMNRSEFNYVQGRYFPPRSFPSGIGQEAVGEIVALGPPGDGRKPFAQTPLQVGARVAILPGCVDMVTMGVYRDIGLYDQAALAPVPDDYSDAEAAGLWMAVLTMAGAMVRAGLTPQSAAGKVLLLTAASSSMGVVALKLARAWGLQTVATTRSADKIPALAALADHAILATDSASLASGVRAAVGERGYDVALDPVGAAFYPGLIEAAGQRAQLVSYELITGPDTPLPLIPMLMKNLGLHGYTLFATLADAPLWDQLLTWGLEYASEIRPLVAKTWPLSQAPQALAEMGRAEHVGKLVLLPD
jgi:NADPH2:quinone reductase